MIWFGYIYVYIAGGCLAAHVAFCAPDGSLWGRGLFIALWPVIMPPIYVIAIYRAVMD